MTRDDAEWPECAQGPMLTEVTAAIDGGRCPVLVVEVLGLLAHARVARPPDVFTVLGHRMRQSGAVPGWVTPPVVRRLGMDAEHHAHIRAGSTRAPMDLVAIWQELAAAPIRGDATIGADRELTVLADLIGTDPQVAAVLEVAAERVPVLLLGPPEWTATQLETVLAAARIPVPGSATMLARGGHGPEALAQTLTALPAHPDVTGVVLLAAADTDVTGLPPEISVLQAPALAPRLAVLNLREGVPDDPYGADDPLIDPVHGDFGLTALRRTALSVREGGRGDTDEEVARDYGLTVLGPVLTGFAEWVARRAAARGVRTVFCPMREGELLAELIDRAARARALPVTARPMWLSRQVATAAAGDELIEAAVVDCARQRFGLTGRTLAVALGLSGDDPAVPDGLRDRLLGDEQVREFAVAVAGDAGHAPAPPRRPRGCAMACGPT